MEVYCKTCQKVLGAVTDEKIPPNTKKYATCHTCGERILLFREVKAPPPADDSEREEREDLLSQELPPTSDKEQPDSPSDQDILNEQSLILRPQFTGSAGEYFRIWIVNIFLTIITLGIYGAWAKVRTRRYFYAHTEIDGHAFDYLANPLAILKGNLIIGGAFILYSAGDFIHPYVTLAMAGLIAILFPFLIYKSLRFYAHNSAFRNIRFKFGGGLKESYFVYLLIPLLTPFTLGLLAPYWMYRRKGYFFNNFAFGDTGSNFSGKAGPFYNIYIVATLSAIITAACIAALVLGIGIETLTSSMTMMNPAAGDGPTGQISSFIVVGMMVSYAVMLIIITLIQQYLFVRLTNYSWHHSKLGAIYFKSDLQVKNLVWIRITNIIAIICSVGLLAPWAKVRRARYILSKLSLVSYCPLDEFTAATGGEESAVGDSATDFFDLEIGL